MKKIYALLLFCVVAMTLPTMAKAEITKLKATSLAYKTVDKRGNWGEWSDWKPCNILVVVDFDKERVTIYSNETQEYDIISAEDETRDYQGGTTSEFSCVDKEGLRCNMRLREQSDGQLQLYVDYNDISFVYNIEVK